MATQADILWEGPSLEMLQHRERTLIAKLHRAYEREFTKRNQRRINRIIEDLAHTRQAITEAIARATS